MDDLAYLEKMLSDAKRQGDPVAVDHWSREIVRVSNPRAWEKLQAVRRAELAREGDEHEGSW